MGKGRNGTEHRAATMILTQEGEMQHAHTMKDNLLFLFRKSFSFDKSLFVSVIARIPVNILIPLITSYLTKYMTSITLGQTDSGRFLAYVLSCSVMILALTLVNNYTAAKIKYDTMFVRLRYLGSISDKNMEADCSGQAFL
ncbi:MAG: hypothetical protein HFH92_12490 [Lachnospiraceae bacterium]|nr:hypothetical protein [Lachnospiraceae bacterium]